MIQHPYEMPKRGSPDSVIPPSANVIRGLWLALQAPARIILAMPREERDALAQEANDWLRSAMSQVQGERPS